MPVCHSTTGWIPLKFSWMYEDPLAFQDKTSSWIVLLGFCLVSNGSIEQRSFKTSAPLHSKNKVGKSFVYRHSYRLHYCQCLLTRHLDISLYFAFTFPVSRLPFISLNVTPLDYIVSYWIKKHGACSMQGRMFDLKEGILVWGDLHGGIILTSDPYSGGPGFKFRPKEWLPWRKVSTGFVSLTIQKPFNCFVLHHINFLSRFFLISSFVRLSFEDVINGILTF